MSRGGDRRLVHVSGDATRSDGHRPGTGYRTVESRLALSNPVGGGVMTASAAIGNRNFGAADFYGPYPSYEDTRTSTATVGYRHAMGQRWAVDAGADTRRHSDLYTLIRDDPAVYQNRHVSWQTQSRLTMTESRGTGSTVAGIEAFDATLASARLGNHDERRVGAFAEERIGSGVNAVGLLSARGDWSSRTGAVLSPTAGVSIPISPITRLRASIGTGFRAPTWTELYYTDPSNVANPDLKPEHFRMAEIGARSAPRWGSLDVSVFERRATELIDWMRPAATPLAPWQTMNIESATFTGVEAEARVTATPGVEWTLATSGLRVRSRSSSALVGKYALTPITSSSALTARPRTILGTQVSATLTRARRAEEDSYWRADASVRHSMGPLALRIDGLNLANASYRDAAALPVAGRAIFVGLTNERTGRR
jgi:iron complex outermembrane receptor protein